MANVQKFLDNQTGLPALWAAIKLKFVQKEEGKSLTSNDFTNALKAKLEALDPDAVANQNAFSNILVGQDTLSATLETDTFEIAAGSNVQVAGSGKTVTISATDTTYTEATSSTAGLMSAADKNKLDGVEAGAEANQNAFQKVKVGANTITAASEDATVEFEAGENVQVAADASTGKVTISATDTTYAVATSSTNGLLSAADKAKLDQLDPSQDANVIEIVKVNGTAEPVDPTDKSVDITVPTDNNQLTNGAGYQTAQDVQDAIDLAVASAYVYKGSVADEASLPASGQKTGDVYNIAAASSYGPAGMNVAWNGTAWDALGSSITIEAMTAAEVNEICV